MILDDLQSVILDRKCHPREDSYVSALLAKGSDEILKKIGEEAVEVIVASKDGNKERVVQELADLWFHCMVLLPEHGLSHKDIFRELEKRFREQGKRND
ncbi:MAG: phosphoribosyl-ATP diphosphatase [Nitrospirae bacterium]|nr:phosphoribosyl-ATP diphosphatase [Nitrospirota bacterium]